MDASSFDPDSPAAAGGLFGLPHSADEAAALVLPVPFEATTSYRRGTAHGPSAIAAASRQVDLFDLDFGRTWQAGVHLLETPARISELDAEACELAEPVIAAGGAGDDADLRSKLERVNAIGAELNGIVHARTVEGLERGKLVCVLGGDHSVPFGAIAACAEQHPGLGVLHFDAHADLRVAYEGFTWSHASILHNVLERADGVARLVQVGLRDVGEGELEALERAGERVHAVFDRDWARARLEGRLPALVRESLARLPEEVYVSFDVDGLDPTLCPSTGTPVPGGLLWHEAVLWLVELARSGRRVVGLDLVEVSPGPDGDPDGEGWDAIVGARLLYKLLGSALKSRGQVRNEGRPAP